jgi:hypothetical protein
VSVNSNSVHPYQQFVRTQNWVVLDRAVSELVKNSDLQETTAHEYVVGYLCKALADPQERTKPSREEVLQAIRAFRADVQAVNATHRDPEAELIAERRAEAARE